jgi:acyl-CoA thioesterase-1
MMDDTSTLLAPAATSALARDRPRRRGIACEATKAAPMAARVFVTAVALLLTRIALSAAEAPEPNYIVALGASGIHGKGVPLGEAYPAQLETMLRAAGFNVRVLNAGVDGDTTARMLMRMDSVIPAGTKVAILQPGTNDFRNKRSLSVDQHLANVEAIVSRLSAQRIRVVICSSGAAEAALARRYDAIAMPCADRAHLIDGEHLDPTGHRNVAEQLLPVIEGMLRQRP